MTVIGSPARPDGQPMCANWCARLPVVATDLRPECEQLAHRSGRSGRPHEATHQGRRTNHNAAGPGRGARRPARRRRGLAALPPGRTWIDMSSSSPDAAEPIQRLARERGVHTLEAPSVGASRPRGTAACQLFAAGDAAVSPASGRCSRCSATRPDPPPRPARRRLHGGSCWSTCVVRSGRSRRRGAAAARAPASTCRVLHEYFNSSSAASTFLRRDLAALLTGDYLESFARPDLRGAGCTGRMARAHGVPFELSDLVSRTHQRALRPFRPRDGELLAVALLEEQAGTQLRYDR